MKEEKRGCGKEKTERERVIYEGGNKGKRWRKGRRGLARTLGSLWEFVIARRRSMRKEAVRRGKRRFWVRAGKK